MKKKLSEAVEVSGRVSQRLAALEEKIFELKAIAYLTLVIVAALLFLALGVLLKALGF